MSVNYLKRVFYFFSLAKAGFVGHSASEPLLGGTRKAGYLKNLAATAFKIYQAELIIFARFVYTSQTIFKQSEQTSYDCYIQHYFNLKIFLEHK